MVVRKLMILLGCVAAFLINGCGNRELIPTVMEENAILLDVRTAEEFQQKHIKGAINLPLDEIDAKASQIIPDKNTRIYIYCRSGRRSKEASEKLVKLGYTNIVEFGGILDWTGEVVIEE